MEKSRILNLQYGLKNNVIKMFIIWRPKQSAEQAIWQASENESLIGSQKQ